MKFRQLVFAISLVAGLGACASSPDYGMRYQDGSYYSPAAEGRGDYYVGAETRRSYYYSDDYDLFFGSGYGWYDSPFYSYGGYCSVRYRYCPRWAWGGGYGAPYGETGFQIYFGSPWDPYWGYDRDRYWNRGYDRSYPPRRPRAAPPAPTGKTEQWTPDPDRGRARRPDGPVRPRPRPEPSVQDDGDAFPIPDARSDRKPFPRQQDEVPPRRSRPRIDTGGGN